MSFAIFLACLAVFAVRLRWNLCDLWAVASCDDPASGISQLQQSDQIRNRLEGHGPKRELGVRRPRRERDSAKTHSGGFADPFTGTVDGSDLAEKSDLAEDREIGGQRTIRRR